MIENVEGFRAQLQSHRLAKANVLEQRDVVPLGRGAVDRAAATGIDVIPGNDAGGRIQLEAGRVESSSRKYAPRSRSGRTTYSDDCRR